MGPIMATVTYTSNVSGNFYLNGELATGSSTHTVDDPKLNFKFVADTSGDAIQEVTVTLYDPEGEGQMGGVPTVLFAEGVSTITLAESTVDIEWTGSGTLPTYGTYLLRGYVKTVDEDMLLMSISGVWTGSDGTFEGEPTDGTPQLDIVSWSFGIVGLISVGYGLLPRRRK